MPQTVNARSAPHLLPEDGSNPGLNRARFWLDLTQALGIAVLLVSALFLIMGFLIMPGVPWA